MISNKESENLNDYLNNDNIQLVEDKEFMYPCVFALLLCGLYIIVPFENNNYTCDNIVVNVYLYVLVSLVLFHIFTLVFVKNKSIKYLYIIHKKMGNIAFFIIFRFIIWTIYGILFNSN